MHRCPVEVVQFGDALAALTWLHARAGAAALVVADERMPGPSGSDLLEAVGRLWPQVGRMLISGYADPNLIMAAPYPVRDKDAQPRASLAAEICRLACAAV